MICAYALLYVVANYVLTAEGQDLTCSTNVDFTTFNYGHRFTTAIEERTYDCACLGNNCEQITCITLRTRDAGEEQGEPEACKDPRSGSLYARGTTFVQRNKHGRKQLCTCPQIGALKIKCTNPQCVVPPPPATRAHNRTVDGSCFDKHNDQWHPYNVPYTRRVVMSYAPDIIGEYRCTCSSVSTRCVAMDIPCCDSNRGRFVQKNERFVAELEGLHPLNCMCLGGRGRIGSCQEIDAVREIGPGQRNRKNRCLDTETNRYYREGSTFIKIKRSGEKSCTCKRIRRKMRIICTRRS